jgi:hypothetical protein
MARPAFIVRTLRSGTQGRPGPCVLVVPSPQPGAGRTRWMPMNRNVRNILRTPGYGARPHSARRYLCAPAGPQAPLLCGGSAREARWCCPPSCSRGYAEESSRCLGCPLRVRIGIGYRRFWRAGGAGRSEGDAATLRARICTAEQASGQITSTRNLKNACLISLMFSAIGCPMQSACIRKILPRTRQVFSEIERRFG